MYSHLAVQSEKWGVEGKVELHKIHLKKKKKKDTKTKTLTEKIVKLECRCGNETHAGGECMATGELC